jgi:glucose-1-phosphate adenylyltransferase
MAILRIHLLGDFCLDYDNRPLNTVATNRLQLLLAWLVLHRHIPQSRRHLAFLFWPDSSEAQARTNLRNLIHLLCQALPDADHYLCMDGPTIQWRQDSAFALDVADFEKQITAGAFCDAVAIYKGDLLQDCYDEWAIDERERLRQTYLDALQQLVRQKESGRDYHAAIGYARRFIRHEPLSEQAYRDLMRLHALDGDRAGVIRAYNTCATVLQNELGVEPAVGTKEVYLDCQKIVSTLASTEPLSDGTTPTEAGSALKNSSNTLVLIFGGGRGKALGILTHTTPKPGIQFAGKYRVIDFVLSNAVNSGLDHIAILTQYNSHSIIEHLKSGEFWWGNQQQGPEIQIWEASIQRTGRERYLGTADAIYQNRDFIIKENCDNVLIMAGDYIYRQDYRDLLRFHREKGADLTIAVTSVPAEDVSQFGMVEMDQNQRITRFVEKPEKSDSKVGSMAIYVFNTDFLLGCLEEDARDSASSHDFGLNIIPPLINSRKVYAYHHNGYWINFNTIETYWKTNLALLENEPVLNLHDPAWMLQVRSKDASPADIRATGKVMNSLITEGCVIEGEVVRSILSPGVRIEKGVVVRDSIIMNDTVIHNGAIVNRCVVGNNVEIGVNAHIGASDDLTPNQTEPHLSAGITVIGKWARIPANITIGCNCYVDEYVTPDDFGASQLPSGNSIRKPVS